MLNMLTEMIMFIGVARLGIFMASKRGRKAPKKDPPKVSNNLRPIKSAGIKPKGKPAIANSSSVTFSDAPA
jgi:uncharacterized protein YneF (UPF0154 family)